ncbi:glycoside hydrolase family 3 N-terminal domain-containing protein [Neolewinella antarctica]|uniref:beta-glucosidase n=1 Tax=Neolewinella antarctica TaxID=442734 RepID=A0ABX0X756_9BACT|nr:glycoside hydrolase family 3 N-terminal domain-containing protein [Neolewinella antarctica]NJC25066.1 beta-glucosidase [Neolewinella antarctica]
MIKRYTLPLLLLFSITTVLSAQSVPAWYNAGHEAKVDSLISVMTLQEKVGQMTLFTSDWVKTGPTLREGYQADIKAGKCGAIFNAHTVDYNRKLQELAVNGTRLGIPLIFGYDVIHGYRTIFPIPLGETASFNPEAARESAAIAAKESAAAGLHWTFAPMVDIARDPRWGRVMEGAGEDVYLSSVMAAARVKGFQGDDLRDPTTVLACAKHFAAYGAGQAGRDYHTVDISERVLEEIYLPPFKATLDAGVATFMTSFNELDGIPASGSHKLLTEILRDRWGFMGFVVTDYTSINEMVPHGVVADEADAGIMAANAGVDMDMQGAVFYNHLADQVKKGEVAMDQVDEAVRRVLRMKYAAGLFDDPYAYFNNERQETSILTDEHRAAARRIGRESLVLLKNENDVLPLAKSEKKILLTGPLADSKADMLGAWHGDGRAADCVTLLTGMQAVMADAKQLTYVKEVDQALAQAADADVIVVAAGEKWFESGEAASRTDINLPRGQEDMIRQLAATGKPVVVVLFNGRPLTLTGIDSTASAIVEAWYPGTEAGNAVADVLFGAYNPAGKLPMTFPRSVGQVPIFYSMKNTGRPKLDETGKYVSKYIDESNLPLYPFGYGLSYTSFSYGAPTLSGQELNRNDTLTVTVTVSNTGGVDGHEVVQLYLKDHVGSVTRPVRELKAFQRVLLRAGETQNITFKLTSQDLSFHRRDRTFGSEPGRFTVFIGGSSTTENGAEFSLNSPSLKR